MPRVARAMTHGTSAEIVNTNNPKDVGDKKRVIERVQILYPGFRKRKRKATRILYSGIGTRGRHNGQMQVGGRNGLRAEGTVQILYPGFFTLSE